MLFKQGLGNRLERQVNQTGDDEGIIEMSDRWNEIWNEVDRRDCVRHRKTEQQLCHPWRSGISQDVAIKLEFPLEPQE